MAEYRLTFTIQAESEEEAAEIMDSFVLPGDIDIIDKEVDSSDPASNR